MRRPRHDWAVYRTEGEVQQCCRRGCLILRWRADGPKGGRPWRYGSVEDWRWAHRPGAIPTDYREQLVCTGDAA